RKIHDLKAAKGQSIPELKRLQDATTTGLIVSTAKKTGVPEEQIVAEGYDWVGGGKAKGTHSLGECFIIDSKAAELPQDLLTAILDDVAQKKAYKFELFDMFVHLLASFTGSVDLHQEIGHYLGVDRFQLGRIHQTLSGDMVRSKSEVIIAN